METMAETDIAKAVHESGIPCEVEHMLGPTIEADDCDGTS